MSSDTKPYVVNTKADLSLLGDDHIRVYRETNGETGYIWNGAPILLLTTTGRKTGQPRTIPIIYSQADEKYVIIASKGGWPTHPVWYLNLLADPNAEIQIKSEIFKVTARTAIPPERAVLWAGAVKGWPEYEQYQARTEREIPVVVLERNAVP